MNPGRETSESPILDRILSKKKGEQTELFSVPVTSTKSIQETGVCSNIFLQPNVKSKMNHQQQNLFPRTLSAGMDWRKPKSHLSLYQLSYLRLSPFPYPLGQGRYYQHLFCLKKKAQLYSLIRLARVFKEIYNIDTRNQDDNQGELPRKKRRLMKGLFKSKEKLRSKKLKIKIKDVTNLPKESEFAQIGVCAQDEIKTAFDLDLAALTISRELLDSVKVERYVNHPPYLEIKIPQRNVILTATWVPYEVKPSGIVRESKNPTKNGIATLLALGEL